jgi:hypothetical protein
MKNSLRRQTRSAVHTPQWPSETLQSVPETDERERNNIILPTEPIVSWGLLCLYRLFRMTAKADKLPTCLGMNGGRSWLAGPDRIAYQNKTFRELPRSDSPFRVGRCGIVPVAFRAGWLVESSVVLGCRHWYLSVSEILGLGKPSDEVKNAVF